MKTTLLSSIAFVCILCSCNKEVSLLVAPSNDQIDYMGRINFITDDTAVFYWPGTSAGINFKGTSVSVVLKDERGENYYNVIIDNDSIFYFRPDTVKKTYILAEGLTDTIHSVTLFKRTEYDRGKTWFYGFIIDKESLQPKPVHHKSIEFFGNSVTCGYAVDDTTDLDRWDSIYTNNYKSYAAITARYFNADYTCSSKSGIGIMISWFPQIMPEIFNRLDPNDEESKWDFSKKTPDLVVINLFQNDSWLIHMPDREEFKNKFGTVPPDEEYIINSYYDFLKQIRDVYPETPVICALGSMDIMREGSPWPGYVEKAVKKMNDSNVYTHFFPYKNTGGHPRENEQKIMANDLIQFIEEKFGW